MPTWNDWLRHAREVKGMSRRVLAEIAGVSEETIASYEYGRRAPTAETLRKLTDALQLGEAQAREILSGAGFPPQPVEGRLAPSRQRRRPPTSLQEEVATYTWPCLVLNGRYEILSWNAAAVRVAERDLLPAMPTPRERNLMRVAVDPHFRARSVNWEGIVGHLLGLIKHELPSLAAVADFNAYLATLVQEIATQYPTAFADLMRIWATATPHPDQRNIYYPVWRTSTGTVLRFNTVATVWSDFDALFANDWHPADAATWQWLSGQLASGLGSVALAPLLAPELDVDDTPWFTHLRAAREHAGMTRRDLGERAGLAVSTIENVERGKVKPRRALILHMARAMQLPAERMNLILAAAGLEPEPSDWASFLAGQPARMYQHVGRAADTAQGMPPPMAELRRQIVAHPWPCLLVGAGCDIAGGNAALGRVLGVDVLRGEPRLPHRNLVRWFLSRELRDRVVNWHEAVTVLVPSTLRQALSGDQVPAVLRPVVEGLEREEPGVLSSLRELWQAMPAPVLVSRVVFPLVWRHRDGTVLAFNIVVARWNAEHPGPYWVLDWHPADAVTWAWLESAQALSAISY